MADDIVDFSFDEVVAQMDEDDGFGVMADDSAAENARGADETSREKADSADGENRAPAEDETSEEKVAEEKAPAADGFVDDARSEDECAPVHKEDEPSHAVPENSAAVVPVQEVDAAFAEENPEEIPSDGDDSGDVPPVEDENRA
ncbi:MAG: hypothetical protein IIU02_09665, partial [Treponema sp.]|uniref:hypothetical protein n=1 Tax=Treponema sp. TaxID=166 RepID=UPI00257AAAA5